MTDATHQPDRPADSSTLVTVTDIEELADALGFAQELTVTLESGLFQGWAVTGSVVPCRAGDPEPCSANDVTAVAPSGERHWVPKDSPLYAAFELQVHREAHHDYRTESCDGHLLQGPLWELQPEEDGEDILVQLPEPTPEQMAEIAAILKRATTDQA